MKKIKILFDANPIVNGNKSGIGYYTQQLIQSLADNYPQDIVLVGHYFNVLGRKRPSLPEAPNIHYVQSKIMPGKILSLTRKLGFQLPLELFFKQRGDVALFTNYVCLPSIFKIPRAIVVHDLAYLETPQYVSAKNRNFLQRFVPRSLQAAKLVMTVSQTTLDAVLHHYSVNPDRFLITPIPPIALTSPTGNNLERLGITKKFILFVGTLEPRKNILNLVKAYEALPQEIRNTYSLVLAGGTGWYIEETLGYIKTSQANGHDIITPGYIYEDTKAELYQKASLFVLPSFYEGFGMPILEAMNFDLPVALSDIAIFHEVAGPAAVYYDPNKPDNIAQRIAALLTDTAQQQKLVKAGRQKLKEYDWQKIAQSVYAEFKRICDEASASDQR